MIRLTLSLAIWLSLVSVVPASLAPRKDAPLSSRKSPVALDLPRQTASESPVKPAMMKPSVPAPESEFLMTPGTEVVLDGQPCLYEEVPVQASIVRMEVAPDRKTVIRVFFRTRK